MLLPTKKQGDTLLLTQSFCATLSPVCAFYTVFTFFCVCLTEFILLLAEVATVALISLRWKRCATLLFKKLLSFFALISFNLCFQTPKSIFLQQNDDDNGDAVVYLIFIF